MGDTNIKIELQELLAKENDLNVLEAIRSILIRTNLDPVLKAKLSLRALNAEQNIQEEKVFNRKDVEQRINSKFGV